MLSRVFIDRPIFAAVLSIVITIAGIVALFTLPVAQYPDIAPPTVQVSCVYPGASARVVADTVAAPIEQQVNGVENMLYMSSQCTNDGAYSLTVTFKLGTDLDMAQVLVQNRVAIALSTLPDAVKQTGVITKKKSPAILLVVNLFSPDARYDQLYLSNYATIQVKDELARLEGVGDVSLFGQQDYSMRVWLDPERLAARQLTSGDIVNALREQNVQVAAGSIGKPPVTSKLDFQYTMTTLGRLTEPEQFADIIVKTGASGQITRLRDVARIELGAKTQDMTCRLDGQPSAGVAIYQLPGSNALATADGVREKMKELRLRFPEGLDYAIVYDTTPFVRESIHEVVKALRDAFILVALVVFLFLQSWRATLIPLIAVPVSLVGTFAVMTLLGFSLNNLSLFGLVLAIGIVVDDAIVVVENVERWLEKGLSPREAAYKSMSEVTVAVIAIAFGLSAVFIPTAFLTGITGQFYRQFALTIATSTLISAFNSLTLSPALAALLLRPREQQRDWLTRAMSAILGWFFTGFNRAFGLLTKGYGHAVQTVIRGSAVALLVFGGLLGATYYGLITVPVGFIPSQDKGYLLINAQLPDSASLGRSEEVAARIEEIVRATPGVKHTITLAGYSMLLSVNGSNFTSMFAVLDDFEHRGAAELHAEQIAGQLRRTLRQEIQEALVGVFGAPPVDGLGTAGGLKLLVEDRGDNGFDMLQGQTDNLAEKAAGLPGLAAAVASFRARMPQLFLNIDRTKCKNLGVPLNDVFTALQANLGSLYVNDFNRFGRTWQVNVQADEKFRDEIEDLGRLQVRNARGEVVPLSTLARVEETEGPLMITRYNMYPSAPINAAPAPGTSSGQAMGMMETLAAGELPGSFAVEWTELALMQKLAGNAAVYIFPLCILFVFLTHSAEYESWLLPLAIILIAPLSIAFALLGISLYGLDNNIFVQIGFVVLIGLACKNAVLIVEFAKQQQEHGLSRREATIEASRLRLRPILMTSLAFIFGVVPLAIATGAGAEMRRTLGITVLSGMLGVTFCGVFFTPVFYYVLQWYGDRRARAKTKVSG